MTGFDFARFAFSQSGDRSGEAHALTCRGDIERSRRSSEAVTRYERALTIYKTVSDPIGEGVVRQSLAEIM